MPVKEVRKCSSCEAVGFDFQGDWRYVGGKGYVLFYVCPACLSVTERESRQAVAAMAKKMEAKA